VGALVVLVDIDAQKRAQEALQGYSQRLEREVAARTAERDKIWQNSNELMAVFSNDGRRLAINPAWSRVLGYREEDLLNKPMHEITHPDDREDLMKAVQSLMGGEVVDPFEDRLRHANGSYRTISWTGVPGEGVFYAIGRDVTEQRGTEEALRQAQKMEAIGQLTGGVAHDFNNLLTIIRSSVEFLYRPDLPEARRSRYIDAISETVERAAKLTSQLLAFARRQALRPEVFDVAARVRSITDMLRTIAGSRIQIVTEIGCDPCYVEATMVSSRRLWSTCGERPRCDGGAKDA
jgi:PAS domain S-box-containing protein